MVVALTHAPVAAQLEVMQSKMIEETYTAGDVVFRQGDSGYKLFAIVSGSVHVLRSEADTARQEKLLAELGEGAAYTSPDAAPQTTI